VFASIVPALNAIRLFVAGTSRNSSDQVDAAVKESTASGSEAELANAISRSGDAKEALQGPFVYVMVLLFSTFFFWIDHPIGVVSIATMAVGDGLADLIGRRFGSSNKWIFNSSKSMAGSGALVLGSVLGSYGLLSWLVWTGTMDPLPFDSLELLGRLFIIATVSAAVELAPVIDDNWSVPIAAGVASALLLN
jgi:dolichol kinase